MRQSIFSAIPRILMEATGIDFVTRKGRSSSYLEGSREGRGDLHWEGTLRGPGTLGCGEAGGLEAGGSSGSSWMCQWDQSHPQAHQAGQVTEG